MARLNLWLSALGDHLSAHWAQHLIPAGAILAMLVVFGWCMLAFWLLIFGGTILLLALELEVAAMICFVGVSAIGSLFMLCYQLCGAVLMLGYARLTLRLQQGHETTWRELLWGFSHPLRSFGFVFVVAMVVFMSASLIYLPLIFLGGWLMLAAPSLADGDRGLFGALGRAWSLSGRAYGELLLLVLGVGGVSLFVGFFPLIGPVAVPLFAVIVGVVVYDSLMRE